MRFQDADVGFQFDNKGYVIRVMKAISAPFHAVVLLHGKTLKKNIIRWSRSSDENPITDAWNILAMKQEYWWKQKQKIHWRCNRIMYVNGWMKYIGGSRIPISQSDPAIHFDGNEWAWGGSIHVHSAHVHWRCDSEAKWPRLWKWIISVWL